MSVCPFCMPESPSCRHQIDACAVMNWVCLPAHLYASHSVNVTDVFTHDLTLAELKTLRCVQKDSFRPQQYNGL
jgi:hypothetical protein